MLEVLAGRLGWLTEPAAGRRPPIQDNINYRRHRNACKHYREDWGADDALYRCICLLDMPPETREEQERCLKSRRGCWRFNGKVPLPLVTATVDDASPPGAKPKP